MPAIDPCIRATKVLRARCCARYIGLVICVLFFAANAMAISPPRTLDHTVHSRLGVVVSGSALITQDGDKTFIEQTSDELTLEWGTFNLGIGAMLELQQPSPSATAVIRIADAHPSEILGQVRSNGRLVLVNTHGIVFGTTATLNLGSFVASTLELTPDASLAGRYYLDAAQTRVGVVNHGLIEVARGGAVALVGGSVLNEGTILADAGAIHLGGADRATLDFDDSGLIDLQIAGELGEWPGNGEIAVTNNGLLSAEAGTVVLRAIASKHRLADLVNNTGIINAAASNTDGGVVRLLGNGGNVGNVGTINVSGLHGGSVQVLSDRNVSVTGTIDAPGTRGGGTIRVGGGLEGEGLPVAAQSQIGADARLVAEATQIGNGGSVVVWARETRAAGYLSARGGTRGGNGGFIETSGERVQVADSTRVNTLARYGSSGDWLIDPKDYTIASVGGDISGATLSNNLSMGNVTILSSGGAASGGGDINVNDSVSWTTHTLTLRAARNVNINSTVTAVGSAGFTLQPATTNGADQAISGGRVVIDANITTGGPQTYDGAVTLLADVKLTSTNGGAISFASTVDGAHNLTVSTAGATSFAGAMGGTQALASLTSSSGSVTANRLNVGAGGLSLTTTAGGITQSDRWIVAGASTLNAGTRAIQLTNAANDFQGAVSATGAGVSLSDVNDLLVTSLTDNADGSISLVAGGGISIPLSGGAISAGAGNLTFAANGGALQISSALSGNQVNLTGRNGVILSDVFTAGTLSLASTNAAISAAGSVNTAGNTSINAGIGVITLTGAGNFFTGMVNLTGGTTQIHGSNALTLGTVNAAALTVSSIGALNLGSGTVAGNLVAASNGGAIRQSGALAVAGASEVNAGSGAVTLTNVGNDFAGAVNLSGGTTQISDKNALSLGTLNTAALAATSTGALNLGSGTVAGNLVAASNNGAISQSGALSVAGTSEVNAGSGAITLTNANNDFVGAVMAHGHGVSFIDVNGLTIAALTGMSNGDVTLTAGGALTLPPGAINTGTGNLSLVSNGGALTSPGALSGANVTLSARDGVTLGNDVAATGGVSLASGATINQSGGVITAGTLTGSSVGSTTLNGANHIGTLGSFSAADFALVNADALTMTGPLSAAGGDIGLTAPSGAISGALITPDAINIRSAPGTLQVQPGAAFSGNTQLLDGTLQLDAGAGIGAVTVSAGATLSGAGSAGAIINHGTVAPGMSATPYATLSGTSYAADSAAILHIAADAASSSNAALSVSGDANLDGALIVDIGASQPTRGTRFAVLSAGAVIDEFVNVTAPGSVIDPETEYTATAVSVIFDQTFTVGGAITGLTDAGLTLQLNGGHDLAIAANDSSFTFDQLLHEGDSYVVGVGQQPAGQLCSVTAHASGTIADSDISDVGVTCERAQAQLSLSIDDGRDHVRYGQIINYVVKLTNSGNVTAHVDLGSVLEGGLDDAYAQWICLGGDAGSQCVASGSGPLTDPAVVLPAGRTLTWLVSTPVQLIAAGDTVTTTVTATPDDTTLAPSVAADTDTLVLFRNGLDTPYGDGAEGLDPFVADASATLEGDAIHVFNVADMPSNQIIDTLPVLHLPDDNAVCIQRTELGDTPQVRLLLRMADGGEVAGRWVAASPDAMLAVSLVESDGMQRSVLLEGAASAVGMPLPD